MNARVMPRFPQKAYLGAVWIHPGPEAEDGFTSFPYPFEELYTDPNAFIRDALLIPRIPSYGTVISLSTASLLMPLTLVEKIELTPAMFENPTVEFDSYHRLRTFLKAMHSPTDYHVLVIPQTKDNRRTFSPAFPFLKEAQTGAVPLFLHTTDYPTDPTASHAAIYKASSMIAVDITTREVMKREVSELAH